VRVFHKGKSITKHNYEPANVIDLGSAEKIVLGSKPWNGEIDALLGPFYSIEPLPSDIDESDD